MFCVVTSVSNHTYVEVINCGNSEEFSRYVRFRGLECQVFAVGVTGPSSVNLNPKNVASYT